MMKKLFHILTLCLLASPAFSADIYITDALSGGDTGADCANAHSAAWFNANASGGNTYHLCGTFTGEAGATKLTPPSGTAADNIVSIIFEADGLLTAPYWGSISAGAITLSSSSYVTIDGNNVGVIKNTANGTALENQQTSTGIYIGTSSNITIKNLTIDNVYLNGGNDPDATDIAGESTANIRMDGNASSITIDNNVLRAARSGIIYDFGGNTVSGLTISNNTFTKHCWGINLGSGSTSTVSSNVSVYGNEFTDWADWFCPGGSIAGYCKSGIDKYHTDGIIVYQPSTNEDAFEPKIYGNYFHGTLGGGSSTAFIYCTHGGTGGTNGSSCKVYNNLLVFDTVDGYRNWGISTGGLTQNHEIYNNTIIGKANSYGDAMMLTGINTTVKNNISYKFRYAVSSYSTTFASDGYVFDNNVYYDIYNGTESNMFHQHESLPGAGDYWTWAQWQAAGFDTASQYADPVFTGASDFTLQAASPAVNKGVTVDLFSADYLGTSRPQGAAWDIGAYEYDAGPIIDDPRSFTGSSIAGSFK